MTVQCRICNKPLKNKVSIERGMGPQCAGKAARADHGKTDLDDTVLFNPMVEYIFPVKYPGAIRLWRDDAGTARCNIPIRFYFHSPTGIEWGYGGSGPADLALNILVCFLSSNAAFGLHQRFKEDFIVPLPNAGGEIPLRAIQEWIAIHTDF